MGEITHQPSLIVQLGFRGHVGYGFTPATDYTIGIDTIEKMVAKMQEKPWPIYKIKLGTDQDIEIVTALRKHTDAILQVDANTAWTVTEALEKLPALKDLGVEFVEQPLAKDDWEGMKRLFNESPLFVKRAASKKVVRFVFQYFRLHGYRQKLHAYWHFFTNIGNKRRLNTMYYF